MPAKKKQSSKATLREIRQQVVDLALERTELSSRQLTCHFTDERRYFLSESSVYRLLKAYDLITSPAYVSKDLREYLAERSMTHNRGPLLRPPPTSALREGQDQAVDNAAQKEGLQGREGSPTPSHEPSLRN